MQKYTQITMSVGIIFIGSVIFLGCKTGGGDIRRIPAPGTGSQENKILSQIAGAPYKASEISCGSYVLKDVELTFSYPQKRLLERNKKDGSSPNVSLTYDVSDRNRYQWVNGKMQLTKEQNIDIPKDFLASIKAGMIPQKDPNDAPEEGDYVRKAQEANAKMIEEGLTKRRVLNPAIFQQKVSLSARSVASAEDTKAKSISFQAELQEAGTIQNTPVKLNLLMNTGNKGTLAIELETPDGTCTGELVANGLSTVDTLNTLPLQPIQGY